MGDRETHQSRVKWVTAEVQKSLFGLYLSPMLCHQIVTLNNKNPQKFNCSSFYMELLLNMKFIIFPVTQSRINETTALSYRAGGF